MTMTLKILQPTTTKFFEIEYDFDQEPVTIDNFDGNTSLEEGHEIVSKLMGTIIKDPEFMLSVDKTKISITVYENSCVDITLSGWNNGPNDEPDQVFEVEQYYVEGID